MDLQGVMSGENRGAVATAMRAAASLAEPFYSAGMILRNCLFDGGLKRTYSLGRPTISIGNLTAGGTGKTPMVQWLADRLRREGRHVAILSRGYRSTGSELGDEQRMLDAALNTGECAKVILVANPNRVEAAALALTRDPAIDLFVLDDAFQHRRVRRDLDIVLLSAPEPFGHDHVLPRGLLREPISGLQRAGAIILTHCDQTDEETLAYLERRVRRFNPQAPIYRAAHAHIGLKQGISGQSAPIEMLSRTPFFAFAGIGAPVRLDNQLKRHGERYRGHRWLADHFPYDLETMDGLQSAARMCGAQVLVTTEKDWVKLAEIPLGGQSLPIWRIEMGMQFMEEDERRLGEQITAVLGASANRRASV